MSQTCENQSRIFEQAVRWISACKDGAADRKALFAWLAESPRHGEELLFALAIEEQIAELTPQQRAQIEALSSDGEPTAPQDNVVRLAEQPTLAAPSCGHQQTSRRRAWWGAIAAGVGALTLGAWLWSAQFGADTYYVSRIGELRTLALPDGSTVHLNARSRLQVQFTEQARELRLLEGEALFKVARDAARPFKVHADDMTIQAVGTQFNVQKRPSGMVVSVLEGRVQVKEASSAEAELATGSSAELLDAGEEVSIEAGGKIARRKLDDASHVIAWQQHRLVFKGDTLADIAAEFNRYNVKPQIRIEGESAKGRYFAGTFDADAPQALIEALQIDGTLNIERTAAEIVISSR